jgi:hypothetical protein
VNALSKARVLIALVSIAATVSALGAGFSDGR